MTGAELYRFIKGEAPAENPPAQADFIPTLRSPAAAPLATAKPLSERAESTIFMVPIWMKVRA